MKTKIDLPKKTKKAEEVSLFKQWAFATTWHGIVDMYNAPSLIIRCIWACLLVVSTVLFVQQAMQQVEEYTNGTSWTTSVWNEELDTSKLPEMTEGKMKSTDANWTNEQRQAAVDAQKEHRENLVFPTLVVCDQKMISTERVMNLNVDDPEAVITIMQSFFMNDLLTTSAPNLDNSADDAEQYFTYYAILMDRFKKTVAGTPYEHWSQEEWLNATTPACEDMFLMGGFNFKSGGSYFDDLCRDTQTWYAPNLGVCYSLQPALRFFNHFHMTQCGIDTGLTLYLEARYADYPKTTPNNIFPGSGLVAFVSFHASTSIWREMPLALAGGTTNFVSFTRSHMSAKSLETNLFRNLLSFQNPKRPCVTNVKLQYIIGYFTFETCTADCFYKMVYNVCGCLPAVPTDLYRCSLAQWMNCIIDVGRAQTENIMAVAKCTQSCEDNCDDSVAIAKHSFMKSPVEQQAVEVTDYLNTLLKRNMTTEYVSNNIIKLNVFNENIRITRTQRELRMSIESLISSIGGTLGVYGGISIITVCQAIAFIVHALLDLCRINVIG